MAKPTRTRDPRTVREGRALREHFIESGVLEPAVRDIIGESWMRSRQAGVDPAVVHAPYAPDIGATELTPIVQAVMGRMSKELAGEPVSMIFADRKGQVLHRICVDASLRRVLEKVSLAPGFSYAEQTVGTNGIGTALERGAPTLVVGDEHFSEPLMRFGCAGAPVHHPVSRALLGVLDLTCAAGASNPLLLTYARILAEQIKEEVLTRSSSREMSLVRDYLAACRHATVPILALSDDLVMMNRLAQQRLDGADRTALIAHTSDAFGAQEPRTFVADLPSGASARLDYRPSLVGDAVIGGVFRVQISRSPAPLPAIRSRPEAMPLPGLAGGSPPWLRTVGQLREAHRQGTWTIVQGEPGVGKHALVRGIHLAMTPGRHLRTLDAAVAAEDPDSWYQEVEEEFGLDEGTLVLRHLDRLPDVLVEPLATLLVEQSAGGRGPQRWVVATYDTAAEDAAARACVIPSFDRTVVVEPLRHRPEDVRALVVTLLRTLTPAGRQLEISPGALAQLARHPWPGNVAQLRDVLRRIVALKRSGTIELADLPAECMSVGRRTFTPLEALERDAITRALHDHRGNKALAAKHLGMSRATIYRKIRAYDIVASART